MAQPTTAFGNSTRATIRAAVYAGIRRLSSDPVQGLSTSDVNGYIAKWDAFFVDSARWNFQGFKKTKIVEYWGRTTLYSALATSDTYIELTSNASIPTSGRVSINRDEIDYSGKNTPTSGRSITISTATDALGVDVSHIAGEYVEFLTATPSDFGKPGVIWVMSSSGNSAGSRLRPMDTREQYWPRSGYYFYNAGYLYLPEGYSNSRLQLHYWRKGMKLNSDTDNLQTPEKWESFVIWCSMAECYIRLSEFDKSTKLFNMAGVNLEGNVLSSGLLIDAISLDAEQSDDYEVFEPSTTYLDLP